MNEKKQLIHYPKPKLNLLSLNNLPKVHSSFFKDVGERVKKVNFSFFYKHMLSTDLMTF